MNEMQPTPNTPSAQERVTKGLAVVGFIGLLILLAWLIFNSVSYLPAFISNMASVIGTDTTEEFRTYPLEDSISHNTTVGVEWDALTAAGIYQFSYACTPGVSVEVRTAAQGIQAVACDTSYELDDTTTGIDLTIRSTADRFTDVPYTITFTPDDDQEATVLATNQVAVFNPRISILGAEDQTEPTATTTTDTDTESETEDDIVTPEPEPTEPTQPTTPPAPRPTTPTYVTQYEIPVSDPNGTTNLRVRYLGVGELNSNNSFTPTASLSDNTTGAIRFAVTNSGTRTSETWTYNATLPGGQEYTSPRQPALKPNETATLTLGFRTGNRDGMYPFTIDTDTVRDTNTGDNSFSWSVEIR